MAAGVFIPLLLVTSSSLACSLSPEKLIQRSPRQAFDQAQEVFIAKALMVEVIDDDYARITFEVSAVLKGSSTQPRRTIIHNRGLGCEFTPSLGSEALFFLSPHDDAYSLRHIGGPGMTDVLVDLPPAIWRATH